MSAITLRFATADDVGLLLQLIRELATYERAPDAVVASEADLRRHGFGPEPYFEALIASVDGEPADAHRIGRTDHFTEVLENTSCTVRALPVRPRFSFLGKAVAE